MADEAEIEVAVLTAGFSHGLDALPGFDLGIVAGAVASAIPFLEEGFHLEVIEDGFAEGINAREQNVILVGGGDDSVQNDPLAVLAQIVFEFDY